MAAGGGPASNPVLLGYPDGPVGEEGAGGDQGSTAAVAHFTESRIGGRPSLPSASFSAGALENESRCRACGRTCPLLAQVYAPLDDASPYHRVLYVFACVRQECWGNQDAWSCLRLQVLDSSYAAVALKTAEAGTASGAEVSDMFGCDDDWGEEEDEEEEEDDAAMNKDEEEVTGMDEQNGNDAAASANAASSSAVDRLRLGDLALEDGAAGVPMQQTPSPDITLSEELSAATNPSSESSSTTTSGLGGDSNANLSVTPDGASAAAAAAPSPSSSRGAAAAVASAAAAAPVAVGTAEIEADEGDGGASDGVVVAEDAPNLQANTLIPQLFFGIKENQNQQQAAAAAAVDTSTTTISSNSTSSPTPHQQPMFRPFYLAVDDERFSSEKVLPEHERQLLLEYRAREENGEGMGDGAGGGGGGGKVRGGGGGGGGEHDGYEKSAPLHGDVWFHKFASVVRENPGQVLRYYRRDSGHSPLFLSKPHHSLLPSSKHSHLDSRRAPQASSSSSQLRCECCGGPTECEVQILPSIINVLKAADKRADFCLEFGTALIFTCRRSCWGTEGGGGGIKPSPNGARRERVVLQAEAV